VRNVPLDAARLVAARRVPPSMVDRSVLEMVEMICLADPDD
jgi:hypothetical protein